MKSNRAIILCLITTAAIGWGWTQCSLPKPHPATRPACVLFIEATSPHIAISRRVQAAADLARLPDGCAWGILLICDRDLGLPALPPSLDNPVYRRPFENSERAVLAVYLEDLPARQTVPLMLAITSQLSDKKKARYSRDTLWQKADLISPPIRDVARSALRRMTGRDCRYDAVKWTHHILAIRTCRAVGH